MLAALHSLNYRWSSILRSSFTCTFLLPSFFPPFKRMRDGGDGRIPTRGRGRRQMSMAATGKRFMAMPLNGCMEKRASRMRLNSTRTFTAIAPRERHFKITDRNWIANLMTEFPQGPPEPIESSPHPPSPPFHPPVDSFEPRFPIHGDLISDEKFPALFGFVVPPKPPYANPRYMPAWIDTLLSGPFLPPQLRTTAFDSNTVPENAEKLLFLLERAWGHKHDLITELVVQGKWRHAVWIVRALLEPGFEYPANVTQTVFEGTKYTALGNTRSQRDDDGAIPSPAIAGRSGLWAVTDPMVKYDIERRRRGFGIVLGSLCGMVLRAGEEVSGEGRRDRMGDHYTDLLPTVRQILAYCHTADFMPEALYSLDRYPRLHILQPRILASLTDAAWRVKEVMVADEAASLGIVGEHCGMEVPNARFTLDVWGSGTRGIPACPENRPIAYAEREVWLELILTVIIEAGYGNVGVSIIHHMSSLSEHQAPTNSWSFIDYLALHPDEYTAEATIRPSAPPETSSIAAQYGLPGHSLYPPPVTTHPLALPDWILPAIVDAVVDSTDEGRGLESMFRTILSYARAHPMRRETLLRLLRHPALTWSKNAEVMEVGAGLLWEFGNREKAVDMYYSSLVWHIHADNIVGAMRVWQHVLNSRSLRKIPNSITGQYLKLLVKHRKLGYAWNLLRSHPTAIVPSPVIPKKEYHLPSLAPPLLALAVHAQSRKLYTNVVGAVSQARSGGCWTPETTFTSVLNAHLSFGAVALAKQVLIEMRKDGISPDGVNVAILMKHELDRDPAAGFRLAEVSAPEPRQRWPAGRPAESLQRPAWVTILDYAVREANPARTSWALANLNVDPRTGTGMDTIVFNILLRGVAARDGCISAMYMCHRFHTRGVEVTGKALGDATSFRTVLHSAVRELLRLKAGDDGKGSREERREKRAKRKEIEDVITWCWDELRNSGIEIVDVIKTVRVWLAGEGSIAKENEGKVQYGQGDVKVGKQMEKMKVEETGETGEGGKTGKTGEIGETGETGETGERAKKKERKRKPPRGRRKPKDPSLRKHFKYTGKKGGKK